MSQTVGKALAQQQTGALALMGQHREELFAVLPSHVQPASWLAGAQAAVRRDKALFAAANANPGSLMNALSRAARLGLEPGTEQYYLTYRKLKTGLEVQGIVGYMGEVELIYRAGAVSSVVVEVVYENDPFVWTKGLLDSQQPPRWEGPMQVPFHAPDWFSTKRGAVIGAYAYAVMRDGAVSNVVVAGHDRIQRAKAASPTANSSHSPWNTDYAAMVKKTAAHDLQKWVPTSAEYMREQLRAQRDVDNEANGYSTTTVTYAAPDIADAPVATGDVIDGEVEPDTEGEPPPAADLVEAKADVPMVTDAQLRKIHAQLNQLGVTEEQKHGDLSVIVNRGITSTRDLDREEAKTAIDLLERVCKDDEPGKAYGFLLDSLADADSGEPS